MNNKSIEDRAAEIAEWKLEKEYAEMVSDKAAKEAAMAAQVAEKAAERVRTETVLSQLAKWAKEAAERDAKAAKLAEDAKAATILPRMLINWWNRMVG
jgi:hypothetical protein